MVVFGPGGVIDTAQGFKNLREEDKKPSKSQAELDCARAGGSWDPVAKTCTLPKKKEEEVPGLPPPQLEVGEVIGESKQTAILPDGQQFFGLNTQDIANLKEQEAEKKARLEDTVPIGTREAQIENQAEIAKLSGTVGQTQVTPELDPTNIRQGEAITTGLVDAIPRAVTLAGTGLVAGAAAGAVTTGGVASIPLAAAGAAAGFLGSLAASFISNMRSQRRDTTNAQQRTLDEGKQTLQDWSTQAAADPSNRAFYLTQFNNQLQLIQDAHVQMLTDTNADVGKFETAIPNLAEFNSFYNTGGERDALVSDMQRSLRGEVGQLEVNFRMLDVSNRHNPTPQVEPQKGFFESLLG